MMPFIQFKHNEDKQLFFFVNPILISAIFDMAYWASRNSLPFNVTDTISTHTEDIKLKRVSASHRQRRAVDIGSIGWPDKLIKEFESTFCEKYKSIASISQTDLKPRMVLYHNNSNGNHFHIALNASYSLEELDEKYFNGTIS